MQLREEAISDVVYCCEFSKTPGDTACLINVFFLSRLRKHFLPFQYCLLNVVCSTYLVLFNAIHRYFLVGSCRVKKRKYPALADACVVDTVIRRRIV